MYIFILLSTELLLFMSQRDDENGDLMKSKVDDQFTEDVYYYFSEDNRHLKI